MNYAALDIGGTKILSGLVTEWGDILKRHEVPTYAELGAEHVLSSAYQLVNDIVSESKDIAAIGISTAGRVDTDKGMVVYATETLPGWTNTPLKHLFENKFGIPVHVENDVNAAAIGESWIGAGADLKSFVGVWLGTGVGGAFYHDGGIWHGAGWNAAEIGHTMMRARGRACSCGLNGCVEQYLSGTAIGNRYSELTHGDRFTAQEVFEMSAAGNILAKQVIGEFSSDLADLLISLQNLYDPESFIIGGGVTQASALWLNATQQEISKYHSHVNIRLAKFKDAAGILGATKICIGS